MKKYLLYFIYIIMICFSILDAAGAASTTTTEEMQIINGANDFAFKIFNKLYAEQHSKNIVIAPQSITNALVMTYNGAAKNTKQEMAKVLGLDSYALNTIDQTYLDLASSWQKLGSEIQLLTANSLWASKDIKISSDFAARNQKYFNAKINLVDFSSANAVTLINNWVKKNTKNKISKIVDMIDKNTQLILLDAIYFKGKWETKFKPDDTTSKPFYSLGSGKKDVPTMYQDGQYLYLENGDFQAVMLPYGQTKQIGMYVFLPKENTTLDQLIAKLTITNWNKWLEEFKWEHGGILLPRFSADYDKDLKYCLNALGIKDAFISDLAEFKGITDAKKFSISNVLHKAVIDVNEEGTEAAAVTGDLMGGFAPGGAPPSRFEFVANRPFLYAIVDYKNKAIIFIGVVVDIKT